MLGFEARKNIEDKYQEWRRENRAEDTAYNVICFMFQYGLINEEAYHALIPDSGRKKHRNRVFYEELYGE